jgi:hypothetical protein
VDDMSRFWKADSTDSVLQPCFPLVASASAVPATEAICELHFKAGGRLCLLGSRVESILMTDFNAQLADDYGA